MGDERSQLGFEELEATDGWLAAVEDGEKRASRPKAAVGMFRRLVIPLTFVVGLGVGWVVLGWMVWPVQWSDTDPWDLRPQFQRWYVRLVAEDYHRAKNATRVEAALAGWDPRALSELLQQMATESASLEEREFLLGLQDALGSTETRLPVSMFGRRTIIFSAALAVLALVAAAAIGGGLVFQHLALQRVVARIPTMQPRVEAAGGEEWPYREEPASTPLSSQDAAFSDVGLVQETQWRGRELVQEGRWPGKGMVLEEHWPDEGSAQAARWSGEGLGQEEQSLAGEWLQEGQQSGDGLAQEQRWPSGAPIQEEETGQGYPQETQWVGQDQLPEGQWPDQGPRQEGETGQEQPLEAQGMAQEQSPEGQWADQGQQQVGEAGQEQSPEIQGMGQGQSQEEQGTGGGADQEEGSDEEETGEEEETEQEAEKAEELWPGEEEEEVFDEEGEEEDMFSDLFEDEDENLGRLEALVEGLGEIEINDLLQLTHKVYTGFGARR